MSIFRMRNLIDLNGLSLKDYKSLLEQIATFKKGPKVPFFLPKNEFVANVFLESSTRTRVSFELAAKRLGYETINLDSASSSIQKGESLEDSIATVHNIGVKNFILRCSQELKEVKSLAENYCNLRIINAGSGKSSHPTQALLDLFTIYENFNRIEDLKIAFVGDVSHSRVVSSHLEMWNTIGAQINICSCAKEVDSMNNKDIDEIIDQVDILYLLRLQEERHKNKTNMSDSDYHKMYGLTLERYKKLKDSAIVMHPGPFLRDKEIASKLVEAEKSRIWQQVNNGLFTRMVLMQNIFQWKEMS